MIAIGIALLFIAGLAGELLSTNPYPFGRSFREGVLNGLYYIGLTIFFTGVVVFSWRYLP